MTQLICNEMTCVHHDGDGCMLDEVELSTEYTDLPSCPDVDHDPEKVRERKRAMELEWATAPQRKALREVGRESGLMPDPSLVKPSRHIFREAGLAPRDPE